MFLRQGGLEFQILETKRALEQLGCRVFFYHEPEATVGDVDIYHHFSVHPTSTTVWEYFQANSKKNVLSPIFQQADRVGRAKLAKLFSLSMGLDLFGYRTAKKRVNNVSAFQFLGPGEREEFNKFYNLKLEFINLLTQ